MNQVQKTARQIIKMSFNFSVFTIEKFHDMTSYKNKAEKLRNYPEGTLGRDIAICLEDNQLNLVPGYESHDLKHVLLDFKMTPVDEIRMQAFMLGNGNYTIPCFAILTFGAVLLPDEWATLYNDFKRGRKSKPVSSWSIDEFAEQSTLQLRQQVMETTISKQPILTMRRMTTYGAWASTFAGLFGMLFCLPFLFSSNMADLVGAGFPFLAGAVLTVGGLFILSNQAHRGIYDNS